MSGKNWQPSIPDSTDGDGGLFGTGSGEAIRSHSHGDVMRGSGGNDEILSAGGNDALRVRSPNGCLGQLAPRAADATLRNFPTRPGTGCSPRSGRRFHLSPLSRRPAGPAPALPSRLLPTGIALAFRAGACLLAAALALSAPFGVGTAAAEDATLPTVSVSDVEAYEDSVYITFVVSLSQPSSEQVTVDFSTAGVTATKGTDFSGGSHTVTFPPNREKPQRIGVRLYDDHENEPDETFTFTLANPVGATLGNATATGTIRNDDTGATLSASDIEDTTATLTIAGHTDGWWYKGGDLAGRNAHQCTAVAAGTTAVDIGGLTAAGYHYYEAHSDSSCDTRLAKVFFWTLAPQGVTPTVSVSDAEVSEDGTWMRFWVSLSEPSREEVTVRYRTSSGTATSRVDFRAKWGTLTFAPNRIGRQWVGVTVYDDQDPEPDETFTLTLTNPTGATLGDATATGTIRDDGDTGATLSAGDIEDTTATLTIGNHTDGWWYRGRESGASQQWGTCTAVAAGTTSVGISGLTTVTDYEYLAYSDSACGTKLAKLKFGTIAPAGTPTVSVSDAEISEAGGSIRFKVSLSHPSRENVTVRYALWSGTATMGTDFERPWLPVLHFYANSSRTVHTESVKVYDDQEPEPDETFTLTLTKAWGATLGNVRATGTILDDGDTDARLAASDIEDTSATLTIGNHTDGWWYRGEDKRTNELGACTAVAAGTTSVSIGGLTTITNYDYTAYSDSACETKLARVTFRTIAPAGTPAVSVSDGQVSEDGGSVRFWVSLSHPSRERVTVDYHTTGGTATSGTDFSAESRTLGFSANSGDSYALHVRVIDDQDPEPDETFTVTLSNPTNATLGDATATGTIMDDGDTGVTLGAGDIEDTTATLTVTDHTGGWWYKGRAHSCTAVAAGTTSVSISGLTAVTTYEYGAYSDSDCQTKLAKVKFKTLAPEGVTPAVRVSDAEVSEDGTWMQFWVSLSEPTRAEVTVDVRTSDGTAAGGSDFEAASRTLTFAPNSTEAELMPVLVHDDRLPEPDETFTVTLTNPTNATLGDATATGTIRNDDTGAAAVVLASDPGDDGTYAAGDTIRVAVTFSEAMDVDMEDGTPRLKLDLGGEERPGERWAAYEDGSGTDTLTFAWKAAAPDEAADGIAVLANSLELNGGTITSKATQADAALGHAGLAADPAHMVDAMAPTLVRGEIDGGTMTLFFSEALDPDATGGRFMMSVATPEYLDGVGFTARGEVSVDGATVTVGLDSHRGYPRATAGLTEGNWVIYARRADGGDGPLSDLAGNPVMAKDGMVSGDGTRLKYVKIDLANVTAGGPPVTGVAVVSDAGDDATYALGEKIRVAVTFGAAVEVDTTGGTPGLAIDMDPAHWGEKRAAYESGSGTATLVFAHEVAEPNISTRGIAVLANTLALHGGTIRSAATQEGAGLGHAGLAHDPNHKVDWRTQPASGGDGPVGTDGDGGPPAVTGVAVVSSPASGDTYMLGETIRVRVSFDAAVAVTGSPGLSIDMDPAHWGTKRATYAGGTGTTSLTFSHTVVEPNYSTQGIAVLANSLALNGGTIRSAASGANAVLGHSGLGHAAGHKVDWRPAVSVADARANEGAGATVDFEVSLSRAFTSAGHRVTVDYATADGTATAGQDYTATSGTLTFAAGETTKTVSVALLDDAHDEGEETFTLRLSNAQGARIADGEATGTIANADPLQQAWLARFGRTVASDAIAAVTARLETPRDAGSYLTLGGHRLSLGAAGDNRSVLPSAPAGGTDRPAWSDGHPGARESRTMSARELLMGTSFRAVLGQGAGSQFTSWGQGASVSRFSGSVPELSLSGETATGSMGMDYERGRFLAGFAMTHSIGEGTAHGADRSYAMGSSVTTVLPFARLAISDRVSAWGLAGSGTGRLTLELDGGAPERYGTDLAMTLAAVGVRGDLVTPAAAGGFALAFKADAFRVRTESDSVSAPGVGNLAAGQAEASRLRAVLDGSRTFLLANGGTLTPSVTLGLRQDAGDAETGSGMELGAGVGYADPARGLDMALRVHGLAGHADAGYGEWGVSGSVRLAPGNGGRGLSLSLVPSYGADPGGSERLWATPDAYALAADNEAVRSSRLDAELGYGMVVFGGFTGTPNVGVGLSDAARNYRIGWRLTPPGIGAGFELNLDATRREAVGDAVSEHGVMLRSVARW